MTALLWNAAMGREDMVRLLEEKLSANFIQSNLEGEKILDVGCLFGIFSSSQTTCP